MLVRLRNYRSFATVVSQLQTTQTLACCRFLHHGPDTVEELLDRHIAENDQKQDDDESEIIAHRRLTVSRREALTLYRDIIRATRFFTWPDSRGVMWRDILRENARKEFEDARYERDPEIVTRLLVGGRDALQAALDKLVERHRRHIDEEKNDIHRR